MRRATASNFCCSVNWRLVLVGLVIGGESDGHGVAPSDLSTERGEAQAVYDDAVQLHDPTQEKRGTTRLRIGADGTIVEHRDTFDFVGSTFAPVPVVSGFVRWLCWRFVS
jgi:hypothetical protein